MDSILRVDLDRLYRGDLRFVQAGIESGSSRTLRIINKDETVSTMLKANRRLAESNLNVIYTFMMGFPTETYNDLMETVDLITQLLNDNPNAEITGINNYLPYPGTDLYDMTVKDGFVPPDSLEGWTHLTYQTFVVPQTQVFSSVYHQIMVMAKFIDGTRMVRRLKENKEVGGTMLYLLSLLTRLYQYRWRRHQFDKQLETRLTNLISNRIFKW